jgi:predicted unusual protein kinase regulating ubiquinone biosynthesis (AarF/ABC1/UbiB family)
MSVIMKHESLAGLRTVLSVFQRHGLGDLLAAAGLKKYLPIGERPPDEVPRSEGQRAASLRSALEELGGTFIPIARVLSARPDVLPPSYIDELSRIRNREKPLPLSGLDKVIASEWGRPVTELLDRVEENPLCSSSLTQTHRGRLRSAPSGSEFREVEIKIVKPGVEEKVEADLALMRKAAELVPRDTKGELPYGLSRLTSEIEASVRAWLDLRVEGRNGERLRRTLAEFGRLRVPRLVEDLSTRRVLVYEHVSGVGFSASSERGPRRDLADELWRGFLKQVLVDGAFVYHFDPDNLLVDHQGTVIFKAPSNMAFLSRETELRLIILLLALMERDGNRASGACVEMGVVGPAFRENEFRNEVCAVIARHAGRPLGEVALELAAVSGRHGVRLPPELMLLGRALQFLEPVCLRLDPGMDPMATAREMASSVLSEEISREFSTERMLVTALELRSFLSEVPPNVRRVLSRASSNDLRLGIRIDESKAMETSIRKVADRITLGLVTASLIVGSPLLLNVDVGPKVWGYPVFALAGFVLSAGLGFYVVLKTIISLRSASRQRD